MKKRLALGVLMGCLITGNMAWAAESIIAHDNDGITYETKNVTGETITIGDGVILGQEYGTLKKNENYTQAGATSSVLALNGGTVNLGDSNTKSVIITTKGQYVDAVMADNFWRKQGGVINVNSENFVVNAEATDGYCHAVRAMNRTTTSDSSVVSKININAKNTIINASIAADGKEANAITAWSQGEIRINDGNLYVKADNVINTRGQSLIEINKNNNVNNIVQLNGNIAFKYDGVSSGTTIDSKVILNLSNKDSYLNGNIGKGTNVNPIPPDKADVMGMNLGLSNGGTWNTDGNSFVNNLTMRSGGVVRMAGNGQKVAVDKLDAVDAIIKTDSLDNQMVIKEDAKAENVTVEGNGAMADKIATGEADASKLADVVVKKDETAGTSTTVVDKVTTEEGVIGGRYEADVVVGKDGKVTLENASQAQNSTNVAISEIGSIGLMAWRAENNDMNKRLGELRNSKGEHGVWTRMTRGESEFKSVKNQYNAYQLGYDEKLSTDKSWTIGGALTYTDAQSSFAGGSGENTHKGFAIYGSKLNEDGSFIDLIAKYARLEHEFETVKGIGSGEYDTNGYSVSAEYGKRFEKGNGFWVEPQVELTYGKVGSSNFATKEAVAYQDGMDSLVGRLGFSLGKDIKDGNVYVRASYLYDFDGETQVTMMSKDGKLSDTYEQDLGGGWFEVGVGTNINLSDATYLYFDVEKTYGGEVATPWQWNAGVRYSF